MAVVLSMPFCLADRDATVTVHPQDVIGKVNPLIFGNNQLAYQGSERYSNRGAGIWDPDTMTPVSAYVELSKEAGITIQRWPGGCTAHNYNWKNTVGPLDQRPNMKFGLPQFMAFCEATRALALITVSVYWGTEQDGADLVEYLNAPNDGSNPNGGTDWAAVRAADGHPAPYGVVYFEYGNEDYHGEHKTAQNPNPRKITPEDYAAQYLKYQAAMKAVDPKIQLGGLLQNGLWEWNRVVLERCGAQMDFAIEHTYTPGSGKDTDESTRRPYMQACLASDAHIQGIYDKLLGQIKEVCGREDLPLAITEYNGWFAQEKPVPYRQALANALRNAEHLRVMTRPHNNILMANFWQFANEYWGMVKDLGNPPRPVKQANFFPYQMYHQHFGDTLVGVDVQCDTWDFGGGLLPPRRGKPSEYRLFEENLLPAAYTWEDRTPERGVTQTIEGPVVTAKFSGNDVNYYAPRVELPAVASTGYRLVGEVKTEGLTGSNGAGFQVGDARGWTATQSCSLTTGVLGTGDWTEVVVEYTTLPDTTAIEILARRLGGGGEVSGTAQFRLKSLQTFVPKNAGAVPDLGVNCATRPDGTITAMVVNKNMDATVPVTLKVDGKAVTAARAWVLSGPEPWGNNLTDFEAITLKEVQPQLRDGTAWLQLPGCSMAAVELTVK